MLAISTNINRVECRDKWVSPGNAGVPGTNINRVECREPWR